MNHWHLGKAGIPVEDTRITCDVKEIPIWDKDRWDISRGQRTALEDPDSENLRLASYIFKALTYHNVIDKKNHAQDISLRHHCQPWLQQAFYQTASLSPKTGGGGGGEGMKEWQYLLVSACIRKFLKKTFHFKVENEFRKINNVFLCYKVLVKTLNV